MTARPSDEDIETVVDLAEDENWHTVAAWLRAELKPPNRWAAFTDEELFFLHGAMDEDLGITSLTDRDYPDIALRDEMAAEIERRKGEA